MDAARAKGRGEVKLVKLIADVCWPIVTEIVKRYVVPAP